MILSRAFVEFVLTSQISNELLEFLQHKAFPEEVFFSTLNYNPKLGAPGAFTGKPKRSDSKIDI